MTRSVFTALGLTAAAAGLLACGDAIDPATQVQIGGERFEEIRFDDLYRPAQSTTKETKTVDLVETAAMTIEGASPEAVVRAYASAMAKDGWAPVQEPQEKRDRSWYASWTKMGRNVVVTAELGAATEDAEAPTEFVLAFQRPTKNDQITGVGNDPITG